MSEMILPTDFDVTRTQWGGFIARTPPDHRFRLAAVEEREEDARRALADALAAWERLASVGHGPPRP